LLWLRGRLLLCAHDWRRGRTATIAVKSGVPVNLASWKEDRFIGLGLIGASSDQLREGDLTAVPRQRLHAGIAPLVYLKGKVKCAWACQRDVEIRGHQDICCVRRKLVIDLHSTCACSQHQSVFADADAQPAAGADAHLASAIQLERCRGNPCREL